MDARRENLLNSLTDFLVNQNQIKVSAEARSNEGSFEKKASMLKTASEMLRHAALKTRMLEETVEKLAEENKILQAKVAFEQRKVEAEKLAHQMLQKGLIKHGELEEKIAEVSLLDDTGFTVLCQAIDNLYIEKISSVQGVDNLTFLDRGFNIDIEESSPKTFAQSFESMI